MLGGGQKRGPEAKAIILGTAMFGPGEPVGYRQPCVCRGSQSLQYTEASDMPKACARGSSALNLYLYWRSVHNLRCSNQPHPCTYTRLNLRLSRAISWKGGGRICSPATDSASVARNRAVL